MAFDDQGRLFVSSDSSGEIYVVVRDEGTSTGVDGSRDGSGQVSEGVRGRWMMRVEWVVFGVLLGLVVV